MFKILAISLFVLVIWNGGYSTTATVVGTYDKYETCDKVGKSLVKNDATPFYQCVWSDH